MLSIAEYGMAEMAVFFKVEKDVPDPFLASEFLRVKVPLGFFYKIDEGAVFVCKLALVFFREEPPDFFFKVLVVIFVKDILVFVKDLNAFIQEFGPGQLETALVHEGFKIQVGKGQAFDIGDEYFILMLFFKYESFGVFVPGAEQVNKGFDEKIGFT